MVAREQDFRDAPAAVFGRTRLVRVLGPALERGAEGLLHRRILVTQRAGLFADHEAYTLDGRLQ